MNDHDEQVCARVGECFEYLRAEHLNRRRSFIEEFLTSPSLLDGAEHLIKYVKTLTSDEHDLALRVTTRVLDVAGNQAVDIRTSKALLEEGIVLRGEKFEWDPDTQGRSPHLTEEHARNLIQHAIEKYRDYTGTLPRRVVLHKTSRYWPEELRGFEAGLAGVHEYDLVALSNWRAFLPGGAISAAAGHSAHSPTGSTSCTLWDTSLSWKPTLAVTSPSHWRSCNISAAVLSGGYVRKSWR